MKSNTAINVNLIIRERGLKKKHVAEQCGYTQTQFSDMLHGRRIITADDIPRLANALGVEPNALFMLQDEEARKNA